MDSSYDIAIVGAGLAGAFAAFNLSDRYRVVLLEKASVASGASGAGAGLVNPFMARKANPVWMWSEALEALESTLAEAGCADLFRKTGVLRPVFDTRQVDWFNQTASAHPNACSWMEMEAIRSRWPDVNAQQGGLFVSEGGSIDLTALVKGLLIAAESRGCVVHTETNVSDIRESTQAVSVITVAGSFDAKTVILCTGADFDALPGSELPLHPLKGQTITVSRPRELDFNLPCLSGSGYVVPYQDRLVLGSTYHHVFDHRNPTDADTREILKKVERMLPALGNPTLLSADAGVRVTVPGTRLPIVGPVSSSERIWVSTGLGSKGLLMGAFVGRWLSDYLDDPALIPDLLKLHR